MTCFGAIFYLNETTRFIQNDTVSCKKKEQNSVVLSDTVPPPLSQDVQQGKINFCFFLLYFFLPLSPLVPCQKSKARCPLITRNPEVVPCKRRPLVTLFGVMVGQEDLAPQAHDRATIGTPSLPFAL